MRRFAREHPDLLALLGLAALGALVYLPYLGAFPLWDPWEPHYSQVAWEMQTRHTWLNPWYRDVDNWWSKPILMLWMLRASLAALWDPATRFFDNELAARLPFALVAIAGGLAQYDWVRRLFGRRVGVLAAVVLLTAPQYVLVGRQVMADTPFVAAYAAGLGYLAVGLFTRRSPPVASRSRWRRRALAFARREWPFVAFWVLEALAVLAKGFVPVTLVALVLAGYWVLTFRWRDYEPAGGRLDRAWLLRRGGAAAAVVVAAALAFRLLQVSGDERLLFGALLALGAALVVALGVFRDLPPSAHALRLCVRVRASWGVPLFLAVAGPWFVYMTVAHGWPYWREFIFYHHLGRAAGTIDKPGGTFDFYVRQVGYGLFPWSAFLPVALWRFLGRSSPGRSVAERRNLLVVLAVLLPYLFFTLAGTKFAHYVLPVVPFAAVLVAATLVWLGERGEPWVRLQEPVPPVGPPVPPHAPDDVPWWRRPGARGDLALAAGVSLVAFGILAHDLAIDFRLFPRLFVYYQTRATPPGYQPYILLQVLFAPMGIAIGLWLLSRWVRRWHVAVFGAASVVLACWLGWAMMPALGDTYTYEPVVRAYERLAKPGEPVGQYNDWQQPERSVIFLLQNRAQHLRTDRLAADFLRGAGRKFVIVDRERLPDLRRVAHEAGTRLYVVFDGHPYARLVSTEPTPEDARRVRDHVVAALPAGTTPLDARFGDSIRLLGYRLDAPEVHPGDRVRISYFYRADAPIDGDWQIFVHGDSPGTASHRLRADHYPVDGAYPTNEWQEGEIVRDDVVIEVPDDYPYPSFWVWTGFYAGEKRLPLGAGAPTDGESRLRGPVVRVRRE